MGVKCWPRYFWMSCKYQKQPSRGVLIKSCPENKQQIYRRAPMPKCDFNKVADQLLLKSHFGMGVLLPRAAFETPKSMKTQ